MAFASRASYAIVVVAAAAVLTSGLVLYWKLSSREAASAPRDPHSAAAAPAAGAGSAPTGTAPTMEEAAEKMARRLKEKGGTGDEWALLARSYAHLQRYPEAAQAFAKALEQKPGDPALIEDEAAARKAAGLPPAR